MCWRTSKCPTSDLVNAEVINAYKIRLENSTWKKNTGMSLEKNFMMIGLNQCFLLMTAMSLRVAQYFGIVCTVVHFVTW
jgi:hypothetical protein